jgi:cholesterol oxidase
MRLASPIHQLRDRYTVVVVGSGYGGGITASRLARAGQDVCVLERGKEFQAGDFPGNTAELLGESQLEFEAGRGGRIGPRLGLFDLRLGRDMNVLVGCGLGGSSLINAGVSLRAQRRVFDDPAWPRDLRVEIDTALSNAYDRAEEMLRPSPYPKLYPLLPKLHALKTAAERLEVPCLKPPLNVSFHTGINHVGVHQGACRLCGDCIAGCNHSAKNSIAMTYLPDAKNHGAQIFTQVAVRYVAKAQSGWRVYFDLVDMGREAFSAPPLFVHADVVILAAGTLGSTEILLRSKQAGLALSDAIGRRFSGNGSLLAFGYNGNKKVRGVGHGRNSPWTKDPVGPCVTGVLDLRDRPTLDEELVIEEGSMPGALATILPAAFMARRPLSKLDHDAALGKRVVRSARTLWSLVRGAYHGAVQHTETYLVMGHDDSDGQLTLEKGRLRLRWPGIREQAVYKRAEALLRTAAAHMGGAFFKDPLAGKDQRPVTVHPLGGCVMADQAERGVVDHTGQVFAGTHGQAVHPGLYVSDASIIPRSLGVNPLLTISALAERSSLLIAKAHGWSFSYDLPRVARPRTRPIPVGIRFCETMRGHMSILPVAQGKACTNEAALSFTVSVIAEDLERLIKDPAHEAHILGTVEAPALSPRPLVATAGRFQLFVADPETTSARLMRYEMQLTSEEGRRFSLSGYKRATAASPREMWTQLTTLFVTLHETSLPSRPQVGTGVLTIRPEDFAKQMTTVDVIGARGQPEKLRANARFQAFFVKSLAQIYGDRFLPFRKLA